MTTKAHPTTARPPPPSAAGASAVGRRVRGQHPCGAIDGASRGCGFVSARHIPARGPRLMGSIPGTASGDRHQPGDGTRPDHARYGPARSAVIRGWPHPLADPRGKMLTGRASRRRSRRRRHGRRGPPVAAALRERRATARIADDGTDQGGRRRYWSYNLPRSRRRPPEGTPLDSPIIRRRRPARRRSASSPTGTRSRPPSPRGGQQGTEMRRATRQCPAQVSGAATRLTARACT